MGADLAAATRYARFVELTDTDVQSETTICVFQPHQYFRIPAGTGATVSA